MIDRPENPHIKITSPLLAKADGAADSKEAAKELATQIVSTMRSADARGYILQLESEEDFNDVDSILLGLRLKSDLLQCFPSFNTWQSNPLFGIAPKDVELLLEGHRFALPRWLREEVDVKTKLMSFGLPSEDVSAFIPMIGLGFPNFATHLAFLSIISSSKLEVACKVALRPDNSVELLVACGKNNPDTLAFLSTTDHSDTSSRLQLDLLRKAARGNELITLAVPSSMDSFISTFPGSSVIDFRIPFDPSKFELRPVIVVDLADCDAAAKNGADGEANKKPDAAIWDDIIRAA